MLIGNMWINNARLRILNTVVAFPAGPGWIAFPGAIVLGNEEHGIIVGLQQLFSSVAIGLTNMQILFNGTTAHDGFFRTSCDNGGNTLIMQGNQQPTSVEMPPIDVAPDTEISLRGRFQAGLGGGGNVYMDLYLVSYYMRGQKLPFRPVCFPGTDRADVCP